MFEKRDNKVAETKYIMSTDKNKKEEKKMKKLVDALASIQEETREVHVCKICGQKLFADMCQFHRDKTGHEEFRSTLGGGKNA